MAAYLVVHRRNIRDGEALKQYAKGVDDTIGDFGGRVVVRSDGFDVLEGSWHAGIRGDAGHPQRITVIAFPDMKSLKAWYGSKEYAPFKQIRQSASDCDVAAMEGYDGPAPH